MASTSRTNYEDLAKAAAAAAASATNGNGSANNGSVGSHGGSAVPFVPQSLVDIDMSSDTVRVEMTQLVLGWLQEQGYNSTAQLLCDEVGGQLRQEHYQRRALRDISRAVDERNWDAAGAQLKKLQTLSASDEMVHNPNMHVLIKCLPFLLAKQQYLELVDEDSGQRAYTFFTRRIKPFESIVGKTEFQRLAYLLTCRSVGEAGVVYPEWRGWSAMTSRAQLLAIITNALGLSDTYPYCRHTNVLALSSLPAARHASHLSAASAHLGSSLDSLVANALSYDLLASVNPSATRQVRRQVVQSILLPVSQQLPPTELLFSLNMNTIRSRERQAMQQQQQQQQMDGDALKGSSSPTTATSAALGAADSPYARRRVMLKACQSFLHIPAVAVGTDIGEVLWIPLDPLESQCGSKDMQSYGSGAREDWWKTLMSQSSKPATSSSTAPTHQHHHTHQDPHGAQRAESSITTFMLCRQGSSVWGMDRHEDALLVVAGNSALIIDTTVLSKSFLWELAVRSGMRSVVGLEDGVPESMQVVLPHATEVYTGKFFPCGTMVITGCSDGSVTIWDLKNNSLLLSHRFSRTAVISTMTNTTGTMYYAASKDGVVRVVDVASGVLVHAFAPPMTSDVSAMCLAPTSATLVVSYRSGVMRLWDTLTAEILPRRLVGVQNNTRSSSAVCFAGSATRLASSSEDGYLCVWELDKYDTNDDGTNAMTSMLASITGKEEGRGRGVSGRGNNPNLRDEATNYGPEGMTRLEGRHLWTTTTQLGPTARLRLHNAVINDVKYESGYLITCGDDGVMNICGRAHHPHHS